ncbi:MAG: carboxymuconolactone decarboxylase family protein [Sulfurospirillaceae bacterium]|nr:carboxymuconolactone decarboxylase family protein [Sulfurospirillaceae bacterium]
MKHKVEEIKEFLARLSKEMPEQMEGFTKFLVATAKPGALDTKQKELTNVALSIALQCESCIVYHVKEAIDAGATREEILESAFQAVLMHGGPALMYMMPLEKAINDFTKKS